MSTAINRPPEPPLDRSFNNLLQVRGGKGMTPPEWYHPDRDLSNQYPSWIRAALIRVINPTAPLPEALGEAVNGLAGELGVLVRGIMQGKYDGRERRTELYNTLGALQAKYPEAYSLLAVLYFEMEMFRFRDWAPDVRERAQAKAGVPEQPADAGNEEACQSKPGETGS